ncbi:MAG: hypothetical protein ACP5VP_12160 [Candidatus Limnocylindrales bacterium]
MSCKYRLIRFKFARSHVMAVTVAAALVTVVSAAALGAGVLAGGPATPSLPATKQATLDAYASLVAREKANAGVTKPTWTPIPIASQDVVQLISHRAAGAGELYDGATQLPGQTGIVVANVWVEQQQGRIVDVFAGGVVDDPTKGVVTVAIWNSSRAVWLGGGTSFAPGDHGALRIVGATGETLSLRATDGSTITFDVPTLSFR